jgi:hypothetical protein
MTLTAVGLVHLRRQEMTLQHELQVIEFKKPSIRREMWDRQAKIGRMTTPDAIRRSIKQSSLDVSPLSPREQIGTPEANGYEAAFVPSQ